MGSKFSTLQTLASTLMTLGLKIPWASWVLDHVPRVNIAQSSAEGCFQGAINHSGQLICAFSESGFSI